MRYGVGKKVRLFDPFFKGIIWEIFGYSDGQYRIWDRSGRFGMKVSEDEIIEEVDEVYCK
jgi:hypothetical protein